MPGFGLPESWALSAANSVADCPVATEAPEIWGACVTGLRVPEVTPAPSPQFGKSCSMATAVNSPAFTFVLIFMANHLYLRQRP